MMVVTAPPIMVMVVMTTPPAIMVVMMAPPAIMMMVVMILHLRHRRVGLGLLRGPRGLGRAHCAQYRERVRDRF